MYLPKFFQTTTCHVLARTVVLDEKTAPWTSAARGNVAHGSNRLAIRN